VRERDLHSISRYRTGKNARWRNASFLSAKTRRTASQFRRHVTGTCGLARMRKKYNAVLTACGTPLAAASSCVADFFRDVFVERRALALRYETTRTLLLYALWSTDLDRSRSRSAVDERQLAETRTVSNRSNVRLVDEYLQSITSTITHYQH